MYILSNQYFPFIVLVVAVGVNVTLSSVQIGNAEKAVAYCGIIIQKTRCQTGLAPFSGNEYSFHKYTEPVWRCFLGLKTRAKTPLFRVCSAQPREGNKRCVAVKKHLFLGINVPLWSAGRPCRRPARPQMLIISSQSKSG